MEESTNNTIFVNSTACTTDSATLNFTTDNSWFPHYLESTWLPYHEIKYKPEWHIKKGYKIQLKMMWK